MTELAHPYGRGVAPAPGSRGGPDLVLEVAGGAAGSAPRLGTTQSGAAVTGSLQAMVRLGASDLHLTAGAPPVVRVGGVLAPLPDAPVWTQQVLENAVLALLTQRQRELFEERSELDLAYAVPGLARFRVNLFRQRGSVAAAFRLVPTDVPELASLGLPPVVRSLADLPRGLVLVTGATGSGKSTTLAALLDVVNRTRRGHVLTVEDPIEFLHSHRASIVNQREVGQDTRSFAVALRQAMRQDPDVILVGEMRDLETISTALTAAETGHLVLATLHTQDAAQTVDRIVDVFPPDQQQQVRVMLAGVLQAVVSQALCPRADGTGRVVAAEVLLATPAVRNLVREGKGHQLVSVMQAGAQHGMRTLDQHLAELVRAGTVPLEAALEKSQRPGDLAQLCGRA